MQVSLNWLSEYVDIKGLTPDSIASGLTLSGLEVENIEYTGPKFENIKIAKIIEINNHPNADKLHLVSVDIGNGVKTVVCGAKNIEVGQIIPYASIGSKVFSRKTGEAFELVKTTIRGVESVGMLCSADELGLDNFNYQEEDGILILNRFLNNFNLGDDLAKVLDIKEDVILHTAPTANRGDEMSIIGIAREISAIFNRKFNFSILENQNEIKNINFKVEILDDNICKYYAKSRKAPCSSSQETAFLPLSAFYASLIPKSLIACARLFSCSGDSSVSGMRRPPHSIPIRLTAFFTGMGLTSQNSCSMSGIAFS